MSAPSKLAMGMADEIMPFLCKYFLAVSQHGIETYYHKDNPAPLPPDPTRDLAAIIDAHMKPEELAAWLLDDHKTYGPRPESVSNAMHWDGECCREEGYAEIILTAAINEFMNKEK